MKHLAFLLALSLSAAACGAKDDAKSPATPTPNGGKDAGTPAAGGGASYKCAMYTKAVDVEEKIVLPKCGKDSNCHSGITWKPNIKTVGMIVPNLLDKPAVLACQGEKFINKADPARSTMLAKIHAQDNNQKCPDGKTGLNLKMPPNAPPTYVEPPLSQAEIDCISWWIFEVAKS